MKVVDKKSILLVTCLCGLFLTACQSKGEGTKDKAVKQEVNVVYNAEMGSADISLATDNYSFITLNNVYEGLYRLDKDNKPIIAGAKKKAQISEDGLTYTIDLREGAKWSNGDPVTAKDYVFSWQRTVDPKTASGYAYMLEPVKNALSISEGKKDKSELGVKAVSDTELEVTLEKPTPYFESLLAFPTFFPQNENAVKEFGKDYALTASKSYYNGPFVLQNFDGAGTDDAWNLKKNNKYWDADKVKLDKVNFSVVKESATSLNMFENNQADDVLLTGELAMQKANDKNYVTQPGATTQYLEMNQDKKDSPFKNKDFRQAISLSIDRQKLVDSILGNGSLVANGIVPADMSYNPDTKTDFVKDVGTKLEYDKKAAQEHWEKAKADLGVDSVSFELLTSDTDQSKKLGEYIQGAIQQNLEGVKMDVTTVPLSVRLDRSNNGKFDMVMNNWVGDYADPINFLELFTTDSSYNRGKWVNEEYDKYVADSGDANVSDPSARWQDMVEAEKILDEDLGIIPLFQNAEAHLRAEKVKGLVIHGVGAGYDYKDVYVK